MAESVGSWANRGGGVRVNLGCGFRFRVLGLGVWGRSPGGGRGFRVQGAGSRYKLRRAAGKAV